MSAQTITQKILARAAGMNAVEPGEIVMCDVDLAMGNDVTAPVAIARACKVENARLVNFTVSSVTEGSDALGDVVIQLDVDGRRVTGRGVSSDVVEASARAYLAAVNRVVRA